MPATRKNIIYSYWKYGCFMHTVVWKVHSSEKDESCAIKNNTYSLGEWKMCLFYTCQDSLYLILGSWLLPISCGRWGSSCLTQPWKSKSVNKTEELGSKKTGLKRMANRKFIRGPDCFWSWEGEITNICGRTSDSSIEKNWSRTISWEQKLLSLRIFS